jgi:putative acetyltransferase
LTVKKIEIRRARVEDAEAVTAAFGNDLVARQTLQVPYQSLTKWRTRLGADDQNVILVAEIEGKVVGNLGIHPEIGRRRSHAANFGMSIDPAFWRQGVGAALMAAMIDLADNWMNLSRLELTVFASNEAAIALYRKFGFEEEGRLRNYAFQDGGYVDALTMARLKPAR